MALTITKCIAIISLFLVFNSCSLIHHLRMDEQNDENIIEIENYLKNNNLDFGYLIQLVDSPYYIIDSPSHVLNMYKYERNIAASPVQVRIYSVDDDSLFIGYSQCYGPLKKFPFFNTYPPSKVDYLPNNYSLTLSNELHLFDIEEDEINILKSKILKYEYIIVVYWNIYTKYYSKDTIKRVTKYVDQFDLKNKVMIILANSAKDYY